MVFTVVAHLPPWPAQPDASISSSNQSPHDVCRTLFSIDQKSFGKMMFIMLVIHLPPDLLSQRQASSCSGRNPHGVYRGYPCTTQAAGQENFAPLTAFKLLIVIIHAPPQLQAKIILDHFAALQALMA